MIGISDIAYYIPEERISNFERKDKFQTNEDFIENKIGIVSVAVKNTVDDTSDLAIKAVKNLVNKSGVRIDEIEALV